MSDSGPAAAPTAASGRAQTTPRFLYEYFRHYRAQLAGSLVAGLAYALCTVLGLVVFQVILADVVRTDLSVEQVLGFGGGGEEEGEGAAEETTGLADFLPFDLDSLDLHGLLLGGYESLKVSFGIDDESVIYFVPVLLILVIGLRSVARFANGYLFQVIGLGATNDLRNELYDRMLTQSSRFYTRHQSGELLSRVGNDIGVIQNAVSTRFVDIFQQVPTALGTLWFLISLNSTLAGILFLLVPAIISPIVYFGRRMRDTSLTSQERLADLSNLVSETVRGHRVVKAFAAEEFESKRFRRATARHLEVKLRAQMLAFASGPVIETLAAIVGGGFLIYAGTAVRNGSLTASALVTFLIAAVTLYDPIRKLNKVNLALQEALAAAERVQDVMEEENEILDPPGALALPPIEQAIRFEGVSFAYTADRPVLREIDLTIRQGEVVAFVGASGSGKSTLVNMLPRFIDPAAGAVTIDGTDVRRARLADVRSQIGMVTQETVLFNDSVRENIAYGRGEISQERVERAARAAYADAFVRELELGYDTRIGESGSSLSGGQRQRLAIARAIYKDPPILILDEATSQLDTEAESLVQKALSNLMQGRTSLVIAHRLSTIQSADRILVMREGRIVEEGDHEQLYRAGGYYRHLYDLQFKDKPEGLEA
ncbi:MAG: ABC transporter ATP-binding protein [Acidobacteriota bacterium]